MSNKIYTIIKTVDLINVNFDEVDESSIDTVRKSIDGNLSILKYEGIEPDSLLNINKEIINGRKYFNQKLILEIINNEDWKPTNELI